MTTLKARVVELRPGRRAALIALVVVMAFGVGFPMFELQRRALADGARGYTTAINSPWANEALRTTVLLALGSLSIALVLGTMMAWFAPRLPRRLRWLSVFPLLPIVLPSVANIIGWSFLFSPRVGLINVMVLRKLPWWSHLESGPIDVYTLPWIVLVTGFSLTSFVYLFVSAGLRNLNMDLVHASRAAGSSATGSFFRVVLPLLRPSLIYATAICMLLGLGQFTAPLLLGRPQGVRVLTTEMYRLINTSPVDYSAAAAFGAPLTVIGLLVVFGQRALLGDHTRYVTHGGKAFAPGGRSSRLGAVVIAVYGLLAAILPIGALVGVALSPFWSGSIDPSEFTTRHFADALADDRVTGAIRNSLVYSLAAILIALPLGYVISSILLRAKGFRIIRLLLDLIVAIPLGIPAVILGAGFLFAYTLSPVRIYGTPWAMILVYVTLMVPFATRLQLSGMVALGNQHIEASRVSGAGALATNARITLPMMRSTMGGAAALMFVLLTHEFSASLLVRAPLTQVMGTILYEVWLHGTYPGVAAVAVVMGTVTLTGIVAAMAVGGRDVLSRL